MKTALIIQSYAGANATVARHWPFYKRSGFELFGVGRTNTKCEWPEPIPTRDIGEDSYINGDNLPRRLVECFQWGIEDPVFKECDSFCVIEYDTVFLKPVPEMFFPFGVAAHRAGPNIPPMKSNSFHHNPWLLSRGRAEQFVSKGNELLASGENELGHPDFFFGLVWQTLGIDIGHLHGTFSRNSLDIASDRILARDRIRAGEVWAVHGVKTKEQLEEILS